MQLTRVRNAQTELRLTELIERDGDGGEAVRPAPQRLVAPARTGGSA